MREKSLAKHRHRIFEIYEHRDEAIRALASKSAEADAARSRSTLLPSFSHLSVSRAASVTLVQFKGATVFLDETAEKLQDDLGKLTEVLEIDSKVLLDFSDVESLSPACIDALAVFERKLRNRGRRAVLCSLAPSTRACFYEPR